MEDSGSDSEKADLPRDQLSKSDVKAVSELMRKIGEEDIDPQELLKQVCHEPDSESRTDSQSQNLITTLADIGLEKLGRFGDVSDAVSIAFDEYEGEIGCDREEVRGQVAQEINERLPEQFEYEIIHHTSLGMGIAVQTGCPHCGHDKIFNGSVTHEPAQFVAMTVDKTELHIMDQGTVEEDASLCFIDDGDVSINHITCGHCGAALKED